MSCRDRVLSILENNSQIFTISTNNVRSHPIHYSVTNKQQKVGQLVFQNSMLFLIKGCIRNQLASNFIWCIEIYPQGHQFQCFNRIVFMSSVATSYDIIYLFNLPGKSHFFIIIRWDLMSWCLSPSEICSSDLLLKTCHSCFASLFSLIELICVSHISV